mmetsp:Transcript_150983/g.485206  ORF Transcript_150983/g.485206 Transcript_150983/m.485206 type:complete len:264 (+) Transcript_150983:152-943(+)
MPDSLQKSRGRHKASAHAAHGATWSRGVRSGHKLDGDSKGLSHKSPPVESALPNPLLSTTLLYPLPNARRRARRMSSSRLRFERPTSALPGPPFRSSCSSSSFLPFPSTASAPFLASRSFLPMGCHASRVGWAALAGAAKEGSTRGRGACRSGSHLVDSLKSMGRASRSKSSVVGLESTKRISRSKSLTSARRAWAPVRWRRPRVTSFTRGGSERRGGSASSALHTARDILRTGTSASRRELGARIAAIGRNRRASRAKRQWT